MAINLRATIILATVVTLAVTVLALLTYAWMNPELIVPIMPYENLNITDVQLDEVYLSIIMKNNGNCATPINKITIYQNSTLYRVPIHEFWIAAGDEIPIRISRESFNCTSYFTYQISLTTTKGNSYFCTVIAP